VIDHISESSARSARSTSGSSAVSGGVRPPVPPVIEVVSDVACPWCFIGKRRLEKALALLSRQDVTICWKPFGVGTIDQALLGIVAAKHFFVRQFGPAGKVVILDEVHTYDLYTGTLITALVKRLQELCCTVIVLSATLTEKRRRELLGLPDGQLLEIAYPMVSGVAASFFEHECEPPPSKKVYIRSISGALPVHEVLEHAHHGECVLWIRNTVDEAQETYRALQNAKLCGRPEPRAVAFALPLFPPRSA